MALRIGINGYGRIGRNILRAVYEAERQNEIQIVAINDLGSPETNAHLTQYDSVHGRFPFPVSVEGQEMLVGKDRVRVLAERDPSKLPWGDLGVDVVLECTGIFTTREKASLHIQGGAKKVLISAPAKDPVDLTVVYGVNHHLLDPAKHQIVSNGSCTTNCLAPLAKTLNDLTPIVGGTMNTIHSMTNDQRIIDVYHSDLRRARAASMSMIPTSTGAAKAIGLVLPELEGKLDGFAIRVPTTNVSIVDLTCLVEREVSVADIHAAMKAASEGALKGVFAYNDKPLVSIDFNHSPASSTYESSLTKVKGKLVKVCSWYDNEWGFSNRMIDTALAMMGVKR
ncbi:MULTISPECIES: type I glyceraldehyde-3-phosphate dehydrogenase [Acidithiobacillus]|jgi:glyceraldehyde 3-phosphate dehydrogenase|uniref:NAD-dependent glyceraldehyde-3-phosphate dehydrogenase n=4 Tax=Acidithiobacillus caldus TaxID=33059 RepID=F9ZT44_ACICS|nr:MULTISPECIES: type I glyceraldehyde-3-phosphate dehydrogenase [Acidithiobacillus]AEK56723.1 NAD-dependent glyceraldehyde-3-phosphate dehydrogenase [Acidithiobacillus caldus SM-1]AIA53959.1 NAD-dependent glyceraldehyde-3-phosphate dehydrogenase [Acidithiobacillus caldus ATCC 51756]AUW31635.1 type I glyceraldehyde-3-phosphate dehydrogenase [Acidithiobacillus caldus]MBU2729090.1 type I glyceraldehyde-3-phosphate dehydrogenase [Acidithiobacillus caldus]MBU2736702.1 type I glyceraldehyde-3-phosp